MPALQARLQSIFPRTAGTLYDVVVFVFAFLLPWLLQPAGDFIQSLAASSRPAMGLLMLAIMALQIPGALLKREALHARVASSPQLHGQAIRSVTLIGWLIALFWLMTTFTGLTAVTALTNWSAGPGMGTTLVLASITTAAVGYAAWLPGVEREQGAGSSSDIDRERIGDALLMIAALLVMYTIWQPFSAEIMAGEGHIRREASGSVGGTIAYTIVIAFPFALFYIAPRLLFFIEDARAVGTWIRFAIIYLFAAWRMFFG